MQGCPHPVWPEPHTGRRRQPVLRFFQTWQQPLEVDGRDAVVRSVTLAQRHERKVSQEHDAGGTLSRNVIIVRCCAI